MNWNVKPAVATGIAGFCLIILASIGLLTSGVPTIWCPFPTLTILPGFLLSAVRAAKAAIFVPTLCFFAWHPGLLQGKRGIPKRSYVLLVVLIVMSIVYFITSWNWGLEYQGSKFTHEMAVINTGWAVLLAFGFLRGLKLPPSFMYSLILHWLLFAWLAWYAFPFLGELP